MFYSFHLAVTSAATNNSKFEALHRLHKEHFTGYNKLIPPVPDSGNVTIMLMYVPINIIEVEETSESFQMKIQFLYTWRDQAMSWNSSLYSGIDKVYYPQSDLWLPPYVYFNSRSKPDQLGWDENLVEVNHDGLLNWYVNANEKFNCGINIAYYPFDVQHCEIQIILMPMNGRYITSMSTRNPIYDSDAFESGGSWDVLGFDCSDEYLAETEMSNTITTHKLRITLRRKQTFYILNIVLPVVFLSLTASTVFLLPAEAGEKMGMSITVLLAYSVYLSIIADNLPRTSEQICLIQVYLTSLLGITASAVLLSVLVLKVHHKSDEDPVSPRVKSIILLLRRRKPDNKLMDRKHSLNETETSQTSTNKLFTSLNPTNKWFTTSNESSPISKIDLIADSVTRVDEIKDEPGEKFNSDDDIQVSWKDVAQCLDRAGFFIVAFIITVGTFTVFPYVAYAGHYNYEGPRTPVTCTTTQEVLHRFYV